MPRYVELLTVLIWLALASLGFPEMADGKRGIDWLHGYSSGYLLGFAFSAVGLNVMGKKRRHIRLFVTILLEQVVVTIMILSLGFLVLGSHICWYESWLNGVLPFLPGAVIKVVVGSSLVLLIFMANRKIWRYNRL